MAQQLKLADGRNLDYQIVGAKDGFPLVFIHGTPGAYPPQKGITAACQKLGVKLITLSRAGYGNSSRRKGGQIVDGVADVQALLDHLHVKECVVGGWSGGGPHALAAAARLRGCRASLVVAGVAPNDAEGLDWLAGQGEDNIEEFKAAQKGEEECRKFVDAQREGLVSADPEAIVKELSSVLPEVDKKVLLENDECGKDIAASFSEALKNNCDGWVDDNLQLLQPWGFDFSEIKVPILLYQGSDDKMVPYGHGLWFAEHLPQQQLRKHLIEGEGHISIFIGREEGMVKELLTAAGQSSPS